MPRLRMPLFILLVAGPIPPILAVDGVVLIDQNRAMAGGVTPGDTPGFPVTISTRGSYRLSGNLTALGANVTAIDIKSHFVTIDLNGFSIIGSVDCSGMAEPCTGGTNAQNGSGVRGGSPVEPLFNITIRNGTIQGMDGSGVSLWGDSILIEYLKARSNNGDGISVRREGAIQNNVIVQHCNVQLNGENGIFVHNAIVTGNVVGHNWDTGIYQFSRMGGSLIARNLVTSNRRGVVLNAKNAGVLGNVVACNGQSTPLTGGTDLGQNHVAQGCE